MAAPGMPRFTIDDLLAGYVNVKVPESEIGVSPPQPARVSIEATWRNCGSGGDWINAADPGSRTLKSCLKLDNPGGKMKPMFARVGFSKGKRSSRFRLGDRSSRPAHRIVRARSGGKARVALGARGPRGNGKKRNLVRLATRRKFPTTRLRAADGTPVQARRPWKIAIGPASTASASSLSDPTRPRSW